MSIENIYSVQKNTLLYTNTLYARISHTMIIINRLYNQQSIMDHNISNI